MNLNAHLSPQALAHSEKGLLRSSTQLKISAPYHKTPASPGAETNKKEVNMKYTITKLAAVIGAGLIAGGSAAYAETAPESTMGKVDTGTSNVARETWGGTRDVAHTTVKGSRSFASASWNESKKIGRTIVDSPVIAYQVARGERPLFTHDTASRERTDRQNMALTGHKRDMNGTPKTDMGPTQMRASRQNSPPI